MFKSDNKTLKLSLQLPIVKKVAFLRMTFETKKKTPGANARRSYIGLYKLYKNEYSQLVLDSHFLGDSAQFVFQHQEIYSINKLTSIVSHVIGTLLYIDRFTMNRLTE